MEIIDRNGERWVSRKQLAGALGVKDLEPLHRRLAERGELKEGKHYAKMTVDSTVIKSPRGRFGFPDFLSMTMPHLQKASYPELPG